jgi:hypothetical protein
MMTSQQSEKIAKEWIEAWNSHSLGTILSHYSDEIEFTSPFVVNLLGDPLGTIKGKQILRSYFEKGLLAYPDLRFELLNVFSGVNSLTLYYKSVKGMLAAEVMILNSDGKISKVIAHYAE